jgi:regulator of protease activity HflC (stomatin/prohibitin superfamily)
LCAAVYAAWLGLAGQLVDSRWFVGAAVLGLIDLFIFYGLYILHPNESGVLQLFGSYQGTDEATGLRWTNPFNKVVRVTRRVQTHEIKTLKVNDATGNPIEIGAAVVWRVRDAARAVLEVQDYRNFVEVQSDSALRKMASSHPYDEAEEELSPDSGSEAPDIVRSRSSKTTLRDGGEDVIHELVEELRNRLGRAGIEVEEARITHLAYAPEIAGAMLRRQQARAVVAARRMIVKGAVAIVEDALKSLTDRKIEIDGERRAAMISNLLVVLVSDKDATPVINTGTVTP